MPIYEYVCLDCGNVAEHLVFADGETLSCPNCQGKKLKKLLSATSSASGAKDQSRIAGAGDTGCCGSRPSTQGCVPGTCCGKA
ncbi:FmdB family zinc ribbon protein [Desulfoferrobacter suflitae]|uniref:FmdB family zinc ribbon protein n=1 Tax=Desulfoferrobacter suflitae TaxID=2865782 RepID=UPI0033901B0C